ncbi:MAG: hypothetical protein ACLVEL_08945 [Ruthenibacterium sp.]
MKKARKFLCGLLAMALLMCTLPAAMAEETAAPYAVAVYLNGEHGSDDKTGTDAENAVKTLAKAKELAGEGGTILITGNVKLENAGEVNLSGTAVQRGGEYQGALFTVSGSTVLNLSDVTLDGNKAAVDAADALVAVSDGAVLNIGAGAKLCNNKHVAVMVSSATVNMTGGEIFGNDTNTWLVGGGVSVGGGGVFNMSGGTIRDNSAQDDGGGVGVAASGSFYMSGSSVIRNNTTRYGGGGIACYGNAEIMGGEVKNNHADYGGGIAVMDGGTGVLSGGSVAENTAAGNGPGVFLRDGNFTLKDGSIMGNSTETGSGAGIFSFEDGGSSIIRVQGGVISGNATADGVGDAVCFDGRLELSGSPVISGVVMQREDLTEDIRVDVVGAFSPAQPVTLDDMDWDDGRIFVTYADGLVPDASCFQFANEKWGALVQGQNIQRIEMYAVNIWVYPTERYEYFYTMPGEPFDQNNIPSEAVTKAGYSVDGWTMRKYDDSTVILGIWDMKAAVDQNLALHPIWKLNPPEVSLTANDGRVHVIGGRDTITAEAAHAAPGVTYKWKWYKDGRLVAEGEHGRQMQVTEAGTYKVVVTATDGKLVSKPAESSVVIAEEDHIFPNEWNFNDAKHWKNCTVCGIKRLENLHIFGDWVVTKPATATEAGSREKVCKACGYKVKESIPATGGTPSGEAPAGQKQNPKTGV